MTYRCRVSIVDDHSQAQEGLKALLATVPAVQLVGEAADGREAMRLIEEQQPNGQPLPTVTPIIATALWCMLFVDEYRARH